MKNLFLGTALCALVVTGCSKQDEAEPATPEQGKAVNVTINATRHETPSTRTGYEEGKDKLIVTWAGDDKLGVFTRDNGTTNNAEFTIRGMEIINNGKTAFFEGELIISNPDQQTTVYGYYPYSGTAGSIPTAIPIDLGSQTQTGTTDQKSLDHLAAKDYMAATPTTGTYEVSGENYSLEFEFNPLLTIMSFEIKQAMKVKSIKLEAVGTTNLTPFYTEGAVDITTVDKTFPITGGGIAQSTVGLSVNEGTIDANATGMFNMMIFPIAADKMPTTLKAIVTTTDGAVYTQIKNVPKDGFLRGERYIMELDALKSNKWDGTYPAAKADAAYSGGDGTETDPYLLASAEDFAQFAVNGEKYSKDKFFHLTTDINLDKKSWTPKLFFGNFDGNGHTISNLKVYLESGYGAGLFAKIETATIANLHINGTVEVKTGVDADAGGICGYSKGVCTISGCSFTGSVAGYVSSGASGGICGNGSQGSVTITACCNMGSVTGGSSGGILGKNTANITACYNAGAISKSGNLSTFGGIVSNGGGGPVAVTACYNTHEDEKLPNIVADEKNQHKVADCYAVNPNHDVISDLNPKVILFSADKWPSAGTNVAWTVATNAPGSENQYWQSLGEKGTTKYPKLWWEKE